MFAPEFWTCIEHIGILAVAPFAVWFFRHLTHNKSYLSQGSVALTSLVSMAGVILQFSPMNHWLYFRFALIAYVSMVLVICYIALLRQVNKLPPNTEKRRLRYLLLACPIAVLISGADILGYLGYNFPPITGLVLFALLYLMLLIIAYPQLFSKRFRLSPPIVWRTISPFSGNCTKAYPP